MNGNILLTLSNPNWIPVYERLLKIKELFTEIDGDGKLWSNFNAEWRGSQGEFNGVDYSYNLKLKGAYAEVEKLVCEIVEICLEEEPDYRHDGATGELNFDFTTLEFEFKHSSIEIKEELHLEKEFNLTFKTT